MLGWGQRSQQVNVSKLWKYKTILDFGVKFHLLDEPPSISEMDLCPWKEDLHLAISKTKHQTDRGWRGSKENAGNALCVSLRTWHLQHILSLPATEQQWLGRGLIARCHPHLVVLAQAVCLKWTAKQSEYGVFLVLLARQAVALGKGFGAMP